MDPTPLLVALLVASLVRSLASYRRLALPGTLAPAAARVLVVTLLVGVVLAPSWVRPVVERLKPRLVLLVDTSTSMSQPASGREGPRRFDRARAAVEVLQARYGEAFDYQVRGFGTRLGSGPLPTDPGDQSTDLAAALRQTLRLLDDRARAVFLLTDGRSTRGGSALAAARSARVPVHGLLAGRALEGTRDLAVTGVELVEEGFRGGSVNINAALRIRGVPKGDKVRLELVVDGEVVETRAVAAPEEGDTASVELQWTPARGGLRRVAVQLAPEEDLGDRSPRDDVAESSILIHEQPVPVLMLAAHGGADLGFFRRTLVADPRFEVSVRSAYGDARPLELPPAGAPFSLDVVPLVVLSGFDPATVPEAAQEELLAYLRTRGGALLILGCAARDWTALFASRLASVLPFGAGGDAQLLEKRLPVKPQAGGTHPLTRVLDHPQANLQAWQRLPPVAPALRVRELAGSRVVLSFPYYPRDVPAVVTRAAGRGVVVAVNSVETYLWATLPRAHGDPERVHERFFSGLAAWAADPSRAGGERLRTSKLRYRPGERVRVLWQGPADRDQPLQGRVIPGGGGEARAFSLEPTESGDLAGEFEVGGDGFYRVAVEGSTAAPVSVAVHRSREEELEPDPDEAALRQLAEVSGGTFLRLGGGELDAGSLPPVDATPVVRQRKGGVYWLDEPGILGACLLLFCFEWWMRRRRNLI